MVPCDEGIFVFSSASLTDDRQGAKLEPPTEDHPLSWHDTLCALQYVLTSGRIPKRAHISISPEWKPDKKRLRPQYIVSHDDPKVTATALKILNAERWEHAPLDPGATTWEMAAARAPAPRISTTPWPEPKSF